MKEELFQFVSKGTSVIEGKLLDIEIVNCNITINDQI